MEGGGGVKGGGVEVEVGERVCVLMSVLLKFNSTTATTLSRGTCDCASDLGRGTPSYPVGTVVQRAAYSVQVRSRVLENCRQC